METTMRHPNGINTLKVGPDKVKRLRSLGWREDSETPKEVINFQNAKAVEFIKSKQVQVPEKPSDETGNEHVENSEPRPKEKPGRKKERK